MCWTLFRIKNIRTICLHHSLFSTILTVLSIQMIDCQWPPPLPASFKELRDSQFFVDNTHLIQDALNGPDHSLIRARHGFGKTTFLDMVRRFVELDVFPNGTVNTDKHTRKNYDSFAKIVPSSGRFLTVFQNKSFFETNFGAYPVIFLDLNLKGAKTPDSTDLARYLLNGTVKAAFTHHEYLINSSFIHFEDKNLMSRFLVPSDNENVEKYSPRFAITLLRKLLRQHFQKDVILLIDNIDGPLREVLFDPGQDTNATFAKLDVFGSIFEEVPDDKPPLLTLMSCIIVPYYRWPQYVTNSSIHLDGFFDVEMTSLAKLAGVDHEIEQISTWYGGFSVFNPESIVRFLSIAMKEFKPYWSELGSLETFKVAFAPQCFGRQILECYQECKLWMLGGADISGMSTNIVRKLKILQKLNFPVQAAECPLDTFPHFIGLLENLGYLTFTRRISRSSTSPLTFSAFKVPNQEVKEYFARLLYEAIRRQIPLNGDVNFRQELFEAIAGVDGSEQRMRRLTSALVTLLLASERRNQTADATLAHSIRVHLLHPPPEFKVPYVKTSRSEEDSKNQSDFDLVFVLKYMTATLGYVLKIESDVQPTVNRTLNSAYLDVFSTRKFDNVFNATVIKVAANLRCGICDVSGEHICRLSYLFNDTHLEREKQVDVKKHQIAEEARTRWQKF
nr:PREDICTED: uncharacterized protein LOC109038360 [Bemisia tabaci]